MISGGINLPLTCLSESKYFLGQLRRPHRPHCQVPTECYLVTLPKWSFCKPGQKAGDTTVVQHWELQTLGEP